jgi:glutathione S-transferase
MAQPILTYFDCRSRGQALRFALNEAGEFEDRRVPTAELSAFRGARDPEIAGPFGSLPLLDVEGVRIAQTLAIAGFLMERLDAERVPDALARALHAMVINAAHLDMQVPYSTLMWSGAGLEDAAFEALAGGLLRHLTGKLGQLEAVHAERMGDAGPFFGGATPSVADAFVFESIDRARAVFGAAWAPPLASCPRMAALDAAMHDRIAIARLLRDGRVAWPVSASPTEEEVRERLAAVAHKLHPGLPRRS